MSHAPLASPASLARAVARRPPRRRRAAAPALLALGLALGAGGACAEDRVTASASSSAAATHNAATSQDAPPPKKACSVETVKKDLAIRSPSLLAALKRVFSADCSTFDNVLLRSFGSKSDAGRKLEPKRPLDRAAAQAQLARAHADPDFQRDLASETEGVTEPLLRQLLEAALLERHGHLKARDLLITDIEQANAAGSAS